MAITRELLIVVNLEVPEILGEHQLLGPASPHGLAEADPGQEIADEGASENRRIVLRTGGSSSLVTTFRATSREQDELHLARDRLLVERAVQIGRGIGRLVRSVSPA